jgi:sulfur carrier protein ThiS
MKVKIKANFGIPEVNDGYIQIEGHLTLRDLLFLLQNKAELPFIHEDGKTDPDIEVMVNGIEFPFLPGKLETQLHEGDEVEIVWTAMVGG